MGDVYLASRSDDQYRKQVAIKVVRTGYNTAELLDRFRYERQILADLEHPNIARLLDGGATREGLPYLVMEYVDGLPIQTYCNDKKLSINGRLQLFLEVCSAVQYAHRNLVVHRDIKPRNILVTPDGAPKLLDFGIAKLLKTEDSAETRGLTQNGEFLLTPDYASPEQVRGEQITTATDVYSLGVLVFELLSGHRPYAFRDTSLGSVQLAICEAQPEKPSRALVQTEDGATKIASDRATTVDRLRKELAGDIDNIVLMAIRKEPDRRYNSVEQFAEDIRRRLDGRPVVASDDAWSYRANKFVRRHKTGVAFASAILLMIVGFVIAVSIQNRRVAAERDVALTERRKAEETVSFFLDLFRLADPGETKGNAITAREVLDRGAQRVRTQLNNQPEVQASMMEAIARVYQNLGLDRRAEPLWRSALETRRRLHGEHDPAYAKTLQLFSMQLVDEGRYQEAVAAATKALHLWRDLAGEESPGYAETLEGVARAESALSRFDAAEPRFRRCLELYGRVFPRDSLQRAVLLSDFGEMLYRKKSYAEAETLTRQALAIRQKHLDHFSPEVSESLNNLSIILSDRGHYQESAKVIREALAVDLKLYGEVHPYVGTDLNNRGMVEYLTHDYSDAERDLRRALEIRRQSLGVKHPEYAISLSNLSKNLLDMQRYAESERLQRQALELNKQLHGEASPQVAACWNMLGIIYYKQDRLDAAEAAFRRPLSLYPRMKAAHTNQMSASLSGLGRTMLKRGKLADAEKLLRQALETHATVLPPQSWQLAWDKAVLADCLVRAGDTEEAAGLALEAGPILKAQRGPTGMEYTLVRRVLYRAYTAQKQTAKAAEYLSAANEASTP